MNSLIDIDLPIIVTPTPILDARLSDHQANEVYLAGRGAHHAAALLRQMKKTPKRDAEHDVLTGRFELSQRYRSDELEAFIKAFLDSFREEYIVHAIYFEDIKSDTSVKRDLTVMLFPRLRLAHG